jgi:aldehyde dehydrogenase
MELTSTLVTGSNWIFHARYDNFIGGKWVPPVHMQYCENLSPVTGKPLCQVPKSTVEDLDLALNAAHAAKENWGHTSVGDRSRMLNKIADRMEQNLERLALAETWDNGKPLRETRAADIPLAIDHFRYFAGCIRSQEGSISEIDQDTVAYHYHEPLGVVGQIIPWNFPILMAAWKLAPALATGNCVILKPASPTPASVLVWMELIADILPPGVVNIIIGPGGEIGKALASSPRVAKVSFTGESTTGKQIMQYASQNVIPVTLELGGKSPNIFFPDICDQEDEFLDKAVEGLVMFAFNQGQVCTCPSRALVHESIYDQFMAKALQRVRQIKQDNPLDPTTMMGAQVSLAQMEKITNYVQLGHEEGAECLIGGSSPHLSEDIKDGYYFQPTIFKGHNKMRIFQEEIFGPVLTVTTFKDESSALEIANDTLYGLGAGVWTRDINTAYRLGRKIQAGRVWVNCYHVYPAHAAFGGYKMSGIGRENHRMMLENYQQTKNILVSYDTHPQGFY